LLPERELSLDELLANIDARLLESGDRGLCKRLVGELS
jgi:hypothetical protein